MKVKEKSGKGENSTERKRKVRSSKDFAVNALRRENESLRLKNADLSYEYDEMCRAFERLKCRTELLEDLTAIYVPERRAYDIWQEGRRW